MTVPRVHVLPRDEGGYRACAAKIAGCIVIHRNPEHAAGMVRDAVIALIENEIEEREKNGYANDD